MKASPEVQVIQGFGDTRLDLISIGSSRVSPKRAVVWKLDRLGRSLSHLVSTVDALAEKGIGLRVISGAGGGMETTSAQGRLIFGIFASLAEFERELIRERTNAGLAAARSRGRFGGRPPKMTSDAVRIIQGAMQTKTTSVATLCKQFGITKTTLYRLVSPSGELRSDGQTIVVGRARKLLTV